MKLQLFTSKAGSLEPNLISLQNPSYHAIPTVIVCPLSSDLDLTPARTTLCWNDTELVVGCDLTRPINRRVLRLIGEAGEDVSQRVMETFLRLLAH